MPKAVSKETHFKINQMIKEGRTAKDVAKSLGIHIRTVYRSTKKNRMKNEAKPIVNDQHGFLGYDTSGAPIYKRIGRYGPYVQAGEGKSAKKINIIKGVEFDDVDLKMAMSFLAFPKVIGKDISGKDIIVHIGIYGPYLSCGDIKKSCGKISAFDITLEQATELLSKAKKNTQIRQEKPAKTYPLRDLVKAEEYVDQVGGFDRAVEILYAYLGYKEDREGKA